MFYICRYCVLTWDGRLTNIVSKIESTNTTPAINIYNILTQDNRIWWNIPFEDWGQNFDRNRKLFTGNIYGDIFKNRIISLANGSESAILIVQYLILTILIDSIDAK